MARRYELAAQAAPTRRDRSRPHRTEAQLLPAMDANARASRGTPTSASRARRLGLVVVLLVIGLLGHLFAAHLIGSRTAYRDHIAGFLLIAAVTGVVLFGLGRVWRGRGELILMIFAVVQALLGLAVALLPPGVH